MKRFEFSLQKLLNFKEQLLKREKDTLAAYRAKQRQLFEERERLQGKLEQSNEEFVLSSNRGMQPMQVVLAKGYLLSLSDQIRTLDQQIARMEQQIQNQLHKVVEASREVTSLEKLEEKQREEYQSAFKKAEELFISEFVSNSQFYKV